MNFIEYRLRKIDSFQQRHLIPSFVYGVVKKYGDDNGGMLTIQLTYTMFTTIFPLLLLLVTILTLFLVGDPSVRQSVLHSTFNQFPVVGSQLGSNIHVLKRDSLLGLVVGIAGLIYGSTGLAGAGIYVMEQVWNIEGALRPNYIKRITRSLVFLFTLAIGLVVTTFLSGFSTYGRHNFWLVIASGVLAALANVGLYIVAFRALTPKQVSTSNLIPGAIFTGLLWSVLQAFGGYVVGHYLKNDNATYGTFGTVLGLLAWLYIGAEVTVYGAELNVVLKRHFWPRSIIQPPLTKADQESIAFQATQNRRRPEQQVTTKIKGQPMTQAAYLAKGGKIDKRKVGTVKSAPKKNR
jgi:YihY family inner membrane protein